MDPGSITITGKAGSRWLKPYNQYALEIYQTEYNPIPAIAQVYLYATNVDITRNVCVFQVQ